MSKKLKTFVLHDSSVNTFGFRMLTEGADLSEFERNPVMLYNHEDRETPIGRWTNIHIDGDRILADADFDLADPRASEIARKVEAGYISACSIGAWVEESSNDPSLRIEGQLGETVTAWKVREASICNIGANHNALVLYDSNDKVISCRDYTSVLELCCHPTSTATIINNTNTNNQEKEMMKEKLTTILQLSDTVTEETLIGKVQELRDRVKAYEAQENERLTAEAVALTDEAISSGRLDASARSATLKLFASDHESAKAMLAALPKSPSVQSAIESAKETSLKDELTSKSWDELDRSGRLAELRDKFPSIYEEKYKAKFN